MLESLDRKTMKAADQEELPPQACARSTCPRGAQAAVKIDLYWSCQRR
jgi:hypothetical protein